MKILALEFSSPLRSVAIARVEPDGQTEILASLADADFRGVTGMMLIDRAFQQARLKPGDISHFVVGLGPGSYTGVRFAIAVAQGWQLGRGVKTIGISSTSCLAEDARLRGISGEVTLIVDAQRGEVYLYKYHLGSEGAREVEPLRIAPRIAIPTNAVVIGPEASRFVPGALDLSPSAETLATLVNLGISIPSEQLEPVYLRETTFVKAPPPRLIG
jgi:tRNA threonylcarbamoyl adenosine modification protein YeaZ